MIDLVITGADRIASNGDTANKIGTYTVAIAAKYHNIPFILLPPSPQLTYLLLPEKKFRLKKEIMKKLLISTEIGFVPKMLIL